MGLAETKRKKKLTPSNYGPSAWSNSAPTSSVGFKLMSSMGWAPGQGLGNDLQGEKENVKYSLKDDLLGIGAKKEYGGGVWRGMGEVDDLYRRLEVGGNKPSVQEVEVKEEVKEVKVRGGWQMKFQIGDVYTSSFSREESEVEGTTSVPESSAENSEVEKSKKRKRDDEKGEKKKRSKKEKSNEDGKNRRSSGSEGGESSEKPFKRKSSKDKPKEEKQKRKKEREDKKKSDNEIKLATTELTNAVAEIPESKEKKTKEGKQKKQGKKNKKESTKKSTKPDRESSSKKNRKEKSSKTNGIETVAESKPILSTVEPIQAAETTAPSTDEWTPIPRHMHRARFLAMKRASVMDPNALREILGVKG